MNIKISGKGGIWAEIWDWATGGGVDGGTIEYPSYGYGSDPVVVVSYTWRF